jgi:hypothetical protein
MHSTVPTALAKYEQIFCTLPPNAPRIRIPIPEPRLLYLLSLFILDHCGHWSKTVHARSYHSGNSGAKGLQPFGNFNDQNLAVYPYDMRLAYTVCLASTYGERK